MKLRPYQAEASNDTIEIMKKGTKTPLIVAPTASGKSIIIADLVEKSTKNSKRRVLVLCDQGHLLAQNEEKINLIAPHLETGIYCAGQNRKETNAQVILASRDSLANAPLICGKFDLIICDEAHMIPVNADKKDIKKKTNYGKIFTALECPFVIGLTGTPWRLSTGKIWGRDKFFKKISANIKMRSLIDEGFLSDYAFPKEDVQVIDASNLTIASTGDYRTADLMEISANDKVINQCIDNWESAASDRRCSIFFACSREHGRLIKDKLAERVGPGNVVYIDGETKNREALLSDIVSGNYRCIVNIGVLTTGFDAPVIDCVVFLRATASASLFVQMCLDTETEILTKRGWANHETINKNDIALTFDTLTGFSQNSPIKNIIKRPLYPNEHFIEIDSKRSNFRVTENHEMLVRSKLGKRFIKKQASDLLERQDIFYYPTSAKNRRRFGIDLSDNEIRFLAWVLSDGSIQKNNVTISQSKPIYVKEIRNLLNEIGFRFGEYVVKAGSNSNFVRNLDNHRFTISYSDPRRLKERHLKGCSKFKKYFIKDEMPFLNEMTENQFDIFIEVFIKADGKIVKTPRDGHGNPYKQKTFAICKSHKAIERLQQIAVINGYTADITEIREKCSILNISKANYKTIAGQRFQDRPRLKKTLSNNEMVWCIETEQGTIITRRKGKVTIMGNCGRGLRIFPGKKDCLMLDMAGNFERFYSLEEPLAERGSGKEKGEPRPKDCPRCNHENPPGETICQKCACELPKGGPLKTCKECLTEVPASSTKCGFCGELFISHEEKMYRQKKGIFKYPIYDFTLFEDVVSKNNNRYCRVEIMAGPHGKLLADSYIIPLMIYGDRTHNKIAREKLKKFKTHIPKTLQVYKDGRSKYPMVDVIEWEIKSKEGKPKCSHRWDFDISPGGQKIAYCMNAGCTAIKEFV